MKEPERNSESSRLISQKLFKLVTTGPDGKGVRSGEDLHLLSDRSKASDCRGSPGAGTLKKLMSLFDSVGVKAAPQQHLQVVHPSAPAASPPSPHPPQAQHLAAAASSSLASSSPMLRHSLLSNKTGCKHSFSRPEEPQQLSPSILVFCSCCSCFSSFLLFFPDRVMLALGLDLKPEKVTVQPSRKVDVNTSSGEESVSAATLQLALVQLTYFLFFR